MQNFVIFITIYNLHFEPCIVSLILLLCWSKIIRTIQTLYYTMCDKTAHKGNPSGNKRLFLYCCFHPGVWSTDLSQENEKEYCEWQSVMLYDCSRQQLLSVWLAGSVQVGASEVAWRHWVWEAGTYGQWVMCKCLWEWSCQGHVNLCESLLESVSCLDVSSPPLPQNSTCSWTKKIGKAVVAHEQLHTQPWQLWRFGERKR